MAIKKRFTHLNLTGSNHSQLDAEKAHITGTLGVGGVATFNAGLSGSLTRLVDGSSYLAAGPNIIITSASNGQVTIESTGAGAASPEYWSSTTAAAIFTTGSVLIRSNDGSGTDAASDYGTDLFFFVSGTLRGFNPSGIDVAAFGGDLVVSGGMRIGDGEGGGLFVSGGITVGNLGIPGASITVATSDVNTNIDINKSDDKSISISNNNFSTISDDITISSGTVVIRENYQYGTERPVLTLDANTIAYTVSAGGVADTLGITSAGDITLDATDKIFVSASNGMYVGADTTFNAGLSGSLQRLANGTSYLVAGPNIIITSASNGQVTIESTGAAAAINYWDSASSGSIFTTGSVALVGNDFATKNEAADYGTDVFFFVSGNIAGVGYAGVAAFGGDVVMSGNLNVAGTATVADLLAITQNLEVGGTLAVTGSSEFLGGLSGSLTHLTDGSSYLIAGANVTITSASNGAITIAATDTVGPNYWTENGLNAIETTGSVGVTSNLTVGGFVTASLGFSGSLTNLINGSSYLVAGTNVTVTSASNGQVTISATDTVGPNYWSETGLNEIESTGSVGISSNLTVGGFVTASLGFSGSLTQLADGSSYLIAGANVTITSASNGAITIVATDTVGPNYWSETNLNVIQTTGSADIVGQGSAVGTIRQGGRNKLRVGGLDMTPITGTASTSDPAYVGGNVSVVVSGSILSASFGVWNPAADDDHVLHHHISIVAGGQSNTDSSKNYFTANYAVTSKIAYSTGVQTVIAATEITRDAIGPYAQNWDVNFNDNCDVTVTGTLGPTGVIVQWHVQRTKEMSIGFGYGVIT